MKCERCNKEKDDVSESINPDDKSRPYLWCNDCFDEVYGIEHEEIVSKVSIPWYRIDLGYGNGICIELNEDMGYATPEDVEKLIEDLRLAVERSKRT